MATTGLRPYYYAFIIFASSNGGGWGGVGGVVGRYVNNGLLSRSSSSAFVVSAATITNPSSSSANNMSSLSSDNTDTTTNECSTLLPSKVSHQQDSNLWLYRVQSTTSTMDEARKIVEEITTTASNNNNNESGASSNAKPTSFVISAASQTQGRGTTQRKWKSSQRGNALFTMGIPQASWMTDLKMKNNGKMVPLTLLPLQVGSLVAQNIQRSLEECIHSDNEDSVQPPKVTVKWPNDVLLKQSTNTTNNNTASYEKVAGILIESAKDWFLIGIGINVGYAPDIPTDGVDYGRKATCFSRYCDSSVDDAAAMDEHSNEEYWVEVSQKLANDIAYDLHSWLHHTQVDDASIDEHYSGEAILDKWKSYLDWDMELILRDTPKRERVTLTDVMEDGRVIVKEVETGMTRTLVADYFL